MVAKGGEWRMAKGGKRLQKVEATKK